MSRRRKFNRRKVYVRLWVPIIIISLWEFWARLERNFFIPPFSKVINTAIEILDISWIAKNLAPSLLTILLGYFSGVLAGFICGCCLALNYYSRRIFLPMANFFRAIPSVAKVPVFIAIFGLGNLTRITTVATAVFFVVLLSTIEGVGKTNSEYLRVAQIYNLSYWRRVFLIRIPSAWDEILAGLHVAVQISILVMVVSEMLGSGSGIGAFIFQSQSTFNVSQMWVGMLITGILGVVLNSLFLYSERKLFPWRMGFGRDL